MFDISLRFYVDLCGYSSNSWDEETWKARSNGSTTFSICVCARDVTYSTLCTAPCLTRSRLLPLLCLLRIQSASSQFRHTLETMIQNFSSKQSSTIKKIQRQGKPVSLRVFFPQKTSLALCWPLFFSPLPMLWTPRAEDTAILGSGTVVSCHGKAGQQSKHCQGHCWCRFQLWNT